MPQQKICAVIFDMDGVLTDSEPVINAAAIAGLAEYGVHAVPDDFIPFIGTGENRYIGGVAEKYGLEFKPEIKARVYEIYLEIVGQKLKTYEGVAEMLSHLKKDGWVLAVASSADRIKVDANLRTAGIPHSLFSAIVSGEDIIKKKPSPDIFMKASELINIPPSCCIVIEDALTGIKAARAAGMKNIAITTSFTTDVLEKENPDFICRNTVDIYPVLCDLKG